MTGARRRRSEFLLAVLLSAVLIGAGCVADAASDASPVRTVSPAAGWFIQTGCTGCHSLSVYGVVNLTVGAPDLSVAVEDVPKRFGRPLDDFLREPTGTMAMVLSSRIHLSDAERLLAIEKLKVAYTQYLQQSSRLAVSH